MRQDHSDQGGISADHGDIRINAQNGSVTNQGHIQNMDGDTGAIAINANGLTNDGGSILSNSNINLQIAGALVNKNQGEITAYNQGNINSSANSLENSGLMLVGGTLTGNLSGDIQNNASGYLYGSKELTLTSTTQLTNSAQGQIGTDTGTLSLTAPTLNLNQDGQVITSNGNLSFIASNGMNNQGWVQALGDIALTTPTLNNANGVLLSTNGGGTYPT